MVEGGEDGTVSCDESLDGSGNAGETRGPTKSSSALMRATEVAEFIGSTETQVRNMRARAQLPPPIKVPGLGVRWLRSDLEKWLVKLGERR